MTMNIQYEGRELVDVRQMVRNELDTAKKSLSEVNNLLEQSQRDMSQLTQRNAAITSHLSQVQTQADLIPISDIRAAYTAAMDAQQRLFVMRGRMDKLTSEKTLYEKWVNILTQINSVFAAGLNIGGGESGTLLDKLIQAQETERERLSHQMHDGPAQMLSNFIIQAEIAARTLDLDVNEAKEELEGLKQSAAKAFQDIRTYIFELRPMMLDDLGLGPTMRRYSVSFGDQTNTEVQIVLRGDEDRRYTKTQEIVMFRSIQELMSNAAFHNSEQRQTLQISIEMILDDENMQVTVKDNGKGFNYDEDEVGQSGFGLKLMRERIEMLNGTVSVQTAPTQGCEVTITIPAESQLFE
jgi:two-component system sensor histidine kinase DegS